MKLLPITIISIGMFATAGCSQMSSSIKPEASNSANKVATKQVARSGFNWKWIAGIVAVGLLVNELQDDDDDHCAGGTEGSGTCGTTGGGA